MRLAYRVGLITDDSLSIGCHGGQAGDHCGSGAVDVGCGQCAVTAEDESVGPDQHTADAAASQLPFQDAFGVDEMSGGDVVGGDCRCVFEFHICDAGVRARQ